LFGRLDSEYVKTTLNKQWIDKFKGKSSANPVFIPPNLALKKLETEAKSQNFRLPEVHATLTILAIRKK
jgi:hypothetical protein